ncbi:hypothetical protein [Pseudoalteromonas sp. Ld19]|uniref:hypothetical protein n=1 Tax=Pseudoalteromonas sp. Ld19 TaxID=649164 RepID=UPI00386938AC
MTDLSKRGLSDIEKLKAWFLWREGPSRHKNHAFSFSISLKPRFDKSVITT